MTKKEYIQRYTKAAKRIAETDSRLLPKNQRGRYVRDCDTVDRLQGESNADKLSKGKASDDKMKRSLRLIEKQGLVHGVDPFPFPDGNIPDRPIHPDNAQIHHASEFRVDPQEGDLDRSIE